MLGRPVWLEAISSCPAAQQISCWRLKWHSEWNALAIALTDCLLNTLRLADAGCCLRLLSNGTGFIGHIIYEQERNLKLNKQRLRLMQPNGVESQRHHRPDYPLFQTEYG